MSIVLLLTPEQEHRIQEEARRAGLPVTEYAIRRLLGEELRRPLTARELLAMPAHERDRYLAAAAKDAAPLYAEDLARLPSDRELTAFTTLNGEPFYEDE